LFWGYRFPVPHGERCSAKKKTQKTIAVHQSRTSKDFKEKPQLGLGFIIGATSGVENGTCQLTKYFAGSPIGYLMPEIHLGLLHLFLWMRK